MNTENKPQDPFDHLLLFLPMMAWLIVGFSLFMNGVAASFPLNAVMVIVGLAMLFVTPKVIKWLWSRKGS